MNTQQIDFRAELEKHILARLGYQSPIKDVNGVNNMLEKILPVNDKIISTEDTKVITPELKDLSEKEILLLKLFKEFTDKDEGRVLASELGKFARYVQSEVSKGSKVA